MPADPLLNEQAIVFALDPNTALPSDELGHLFGIVLMACYDRKVEREFFMDVVEKCLNGTRLLRGLHAEVRLVEACNLPTDEKEKKLFHDMAMLSLKEIKGVRTALKEKMELVSQCPTTADKIS